MDDRTIVFSFDRKLGARLFEVYEHQTESRSFSPRRRAIPAPALKGASPHVQRRRLTDFCDQQVVNLQAYRELLGGWEPRLA